MIALICIILSTLSVFSLALTHVSLFDTRSIKPLAMTLKPLLQPGDEVVAYEHYYQDLPFYLKRRINVVDWQNELTFGMQHQNTCEWMINQQTFLQRWNSNKQIYMITDQDTYKTLLRDKQIPLYLLAATTDNVLVSNHKESACHLIKQP
jgi:hypothetical protein